MKYPKEWPGVKMHERNVVWELVSVDRKKVKDCYGYQGPVGRLVCTDEDDPEFRVGYIGPIVIEQFAPLTPAAVDMLALISERSSS